MLFYNKTCVKSSYVGVSASSWPVFSFTPLSGVRRAASSSPSSFFLVLLRLRPRPRLVERPDAAADADAAVPDFGVARHFPRTGEVAPAAPDLDLRWAIRVDPAPSSVAPGDARSDRRAGDMMETRRGL